MEPRHRRRLIRPFYKCFGGYPLVENAERVRRLASIVPGGWLRRHRALARQAEPSICAVISEFG